MAAGGDAIGLRGVRSGVGCTGANLRGVAGADGGATGLRGATGAGDGATRVRGVGTIGTDLRGAANAGGRTRGRSNGERFTGGWNGPMTAGGRVGSMIVENGRSGCTGGLGEASTGASMEGRWNSEER